MENKKKETRGGKRPGSGRPKKPPTTTVAFRVPAEHAPAIKEVVKNELEKLKGHFVT